MARTTMGRLALAAALLTLAGRGGAQSVTVQPGGTLTIAGDSTFHKWSSTATAVAMTFTLADGAPRALSDAIAAAKIKGLEVRIPVAGLKSGDSVLDRNLRKAMKAKDFPDVVYRLDRYETVKTAADGVMTVKTQGQLTIGGQTRPAEMDVEFRPGADGPAVKGAYALKMSDYGISPPTLMLGAVKVRDPISIRFDLLLNKEKTN